MQGDPEDDALRREVVALRAQVAELQRAAAGHADSDGTTLAEREELLREAERVAHLGTWIWDIQSGRVTWSSEMYRILGVDPSSFTPSVEGFFAAVHPEDRVRAQAISRQAVQQGVLPLVDCRVLRPDGTIRHTTSSGLLLFDGEGNVRRMVGGLLDRTESLEAEAELRRMLQLLEEAQRLAQLGSWRFDPVREDIEWSREFRRIAGLPEDAPPSSELFLERLVPEDRARFEAALAETLVDPERHYKRELEGRLRRPDGEERFVRFKGMLVQRADGGRELRGTMLDVTDQLRRREELVHAQKMEAVGRLAAGIAHDFNNLLTVITGNLELLGDRFGAAPELVDSRQALSSAASLTRRLLAFGRKAQLSLKVLALNELVRSTSALMRRLVGDEVRLVMDLAEGLPPVQVDPLELERALVNLVVNARDAMPGGGSVKISTSSGRVDGAAVVELSVADEGPGIAEADLPNLFEPFYTTRQAAGGTGLGLATVLGTAEQHGGSVRVENVPGGGSRFTICLPPAEVPPDPQPSLAAPGPATPAARVFEFLVVDDEPMIANVTRRILGALGHVVRVATQANEALAIWADHSASIDLVICDVVMAPMRGPELVERMADMGVAPRVLFITGYSEEAVRSELKHPVLGKPFSASALWSAINDVLEAKPEER